MTEQQQAQLARMEELLRVRMRDKPRRLAHCLGVAQTSAELARIYDVDEFEATAAGLLHDWDKVLDDSELLARAAHYQIPVTGSPVDAVGVLHGPVAAFELPRLFEDLSTEVFDAIARHTVASCDMTSLDMVVFVADAIEPNRHGSYADDLRGLVGRVGLEELFFTCFSQGLVYVIKTKRYLYPTALDIYNHYVRNRTSNRKATHG